jgi:ureidoglycolate hydrolase
MAEMAHTCRGTINLANAIIHTEDSTNFVISNGGTQSFHLKASSEVDRQKWVTALELAKAKAISLMESGGCASFFILICCRIPQVLVETHWVISKLVLVSVFTVQNVH